MWEKNPVPFLGDKGEWDWRDRRLWVLLGLTVVLVSLGELCIKYVGAG